MAVAYGGLLGSVVITSATFTTTSAILPVGAYAIATLGGSTSASLPITIADSGGGTWVAIQPAVVSPIAGMYAIWIRTTAGTGSSITVTGTQGNSRGATLNVTYWTGTVGAYSSVVMATGTTAYPSVTSPASIAADDMFIAVGNAVSTASNTATASSGFTLAKSTAGVSPSFGSNNVEYQPSSSIGQTVSASFTNVGTVTTTRTTAFVLYSSIYQATTGTGAITLTATATCTVQQTIEVIPVNVLTTSSNTSGTTLATTTFSNLQVDDKLIAIVNYDPSGANVPTTTMSSTGTATITWAQLSAQIPSPATTAATVGVISKAYIGTVTVAGNSTITSTFSVAIVAKTMAVHQFRYLTDVQVNATTSAIASIVAGATTTLVTPSANTGDLVMTYMAVENGTVTTPTFASDTTRGTWSAGTSIWTGLTSTGQSNFTQYKIVTGVGTQTASYTNVSGTSTARNTIIQAFALKGLATQTAGTGAIELVGTANVQLATSTNGTGDITLAATAIVNLTFDTTGTGDIQLNGLAVIPLDATGSGEITLTGYASPNQTAEGHGDIQLDGSASNALAYPVAASGSFALDATGNVVLIYTVTADGTISLDGVTTIYPNGAGSIDLTGTATVQINYATTGSGSISLDGTGSGNFLFPATGTVAISIVGSGTDELNYPVNPTGVI